MSDYEGVRVNKGFNNQIIIKSDGFRSILSRT